MSAPFCCRNTSPADAVALTLVACVPIGAPAAPIAVPERVTPFVAAMTVAGFPSSEIAPVAAGDETQILSRERQLARIGPAAGDDVMRSLHGQVEGRRIREAAGRGQGQRAPGAQTQARAIAAADADRAGGQGGHIEVSGGLQDYAARSRPGPAAQGDSAGAAERGDADQVEVDLSRIARHGSCEIAGSGH